MKKYAWLILLLSLIMVMAAGAVFGEAAPPVGRLIALESTADEALAQDSTSGAGVDLPDVDTQENSTFQPRSGVELNPTKANRTATAAVRSSTPTVIPIQTPPVAVEDFPAAAGDPDFSAGRFELFQEHLTFEVILQIVNSWWSDIPLGIKLWYIFFVIALLLYLLKLKQFRRPLLFLSVLFLGFYLNGESNPISAVFDVFSKDRTVFFMALIILAVPIGFSLLWGRLFCGWICPMGAVQEFLNPDQNNRFFSLAVDRSLKYVKYILFFGVGYLTWRTAQNLWNNYDPAQTLFTFNGSIQAGFILTGILLLSAFISRPFCKYFCPLGAVLAITSRIAPFKMRADAAKCLVCGKCVGGACPMEAISAYNIGVDLPEVSSSECIKCYRCQKECRQSALRVTGFHIDRVYPTSSVKGMDENL